MLSLKRDPLISKFKYPLNSFGKYKNKNFIKNERIFIFFQKESMNSFILWHLRKIFLSALDNVSFLSLNNGNNPFKYNKDLLFMQKGNFFLLVFPNMDTFLQGCNLIIFNKISFHLITILFFNSFLNLTSLEEKQKPLEKFLFIYNNNSFNYNLLVILSSFFSILIYLWILCCYVMCFIFNLEFLVVCQVQLILHFSNFLISKS